jgi:nucleotide-binding universal stress UspA family protein
MIPRFYRSVKFTGRPDLAKVSEVNAIQFPRTSRELNSEDLPAPIARPAPRAFASSTSQPTPSSSTPFEGKRGLFSDFQSHFERLRTVWDPYPPVDLVRHPVKILVGIDNSPFTEGLLKLALLWAEKYHASFVAMHILDRPGGATEKEKIRHTLKEWLGDEPEAPLSQALVRRVEVLDFQAPAPGLIGFAHQEHASLLVVGTHQREGKEKFLLGSVAEQVLKEALCPVLVVPPFFPKTVPHRILVPHDGTHFSDLALAQALILCHDFEAELWVIHGEGGAHTMSPDRIPFLQRMSGLNWQRVHHEALSRPGEGPEAVFSFAQSEGIDLIVMATHRSDSSASFEPSFTAGVVRKTACPVLVVHP